MVVAPLPAGHTCTHALLELPELTGGWGQTSTSTEVGSLLPAPPPSRWTRCTPTSAVGERARGLQRCGLSGRSRLPLVATLEQGTARTDCAHGLRARTACTHCMHARAAGRISSVFIRRGQQKRASSPRALCLPDLLQILLCPVTHAHTHTLCGAAAVRAGDGSGSHSITHSLLGAGRSHGPDDWSESAHP